MKNIAVFASGNGSNLQALIDNIASGMLRANLVLVISDEKNARALKRAKKAHIKTLFIDPKNFSSQKAYEQALVRVLHGESVDLVVLAGFMRVLGSYFIARFKKRIINIHPALLPAFKGRHGIRDAFCYGVKVTGVTVHFVNEEIDHGPIILQESISVFDSQTQKELRERIHQVEHRLYSEAIGMVLEGVWKIKGRRVVFLSK